MTEREAYKELVAECGQPITVKDCDTWQDVKAYGTYEMGSDDNQIWTCMGKLYRLCFAELPIQEQDDVLFAYGGKR